VSGKVFRRRSEGNGGAVDDEANLGPLADGVEVDAAVDEGLREVTPPCLEAVGPAVDFKKPFIKMNA
jgi:hypothetical protein